MMARGEITGVERQVLDWIAAQGNDMQTLLATLVNIDSGSYNKAGVDRVGEAIRRFLDVHEIAHTMIANDRFGNASPKSTRWRSAYSALSARRQPRQPGRN